MTVSREMNSSTLRWVYNGKIVSYYDNTPLGNREHSGEVVERQTSKREVLGSIPAGVNVLCP